MRHLFSKICHLCWPQSLVIYLSSITILVLCNHGLANVVDEDNQRDNTCIPCSATYLAADPNYPNVLSNRFVSTKSCESLLNIVKIIKSPNLHRSLEGEGSHRRLISKIVGIESDSSSTYLDGFNYELVIIESLNGVFADPFELQRLVNHRVYLDAAVFGDTNLELPAALSNSSFVEIHIDLASSAKENHELVIELPLHVRYPPLDGSGYSKVEISQPDLYIRCRKKDIDNDCQWGLTVLEVGPTETVKWLIPCGDEAHTTVVVSVTNELSARGLDVPECDLVVNLDMPTDLVHYTNRAGRAGRTGRLGRKGSVLSVCEERELFIVKKLRRQLGVGINPCEFKEGKMLIQKEENVE